jgi:hypothetical protein
VPLGAVRCDAPPAHVPTVVGAGWEEDVPVLRPTAAGYREHQC